MAALVLVDFYLRNRATQGLAYEQEEKLEF
jgi:hypothetical protein